MSERVDTTYTCPECGEISELSMWKSINVTLNPELKPKLLDGSLLTFICPLCDCNQGVAYPLLYHDQDKRFMVWLMPETDGGPEELNTPEFAKMSALMQGYRLRVVTTFDRLLEKIFIFDNEMDDRVLELLREVLVNSVFEKHGITYEQLFYSKVDLTSPDPVIDLTIFFKDQPPKVYIIQGPDGYPRAVELLHEKLSIPKEETPYWKTVGQGYLELARGGFG
jgi:hypothetical protein